MNLLDHYVTKVMSEPYMAYGRWYLSVEFDCEGVLGECVMAFPSYEDAMAVKVGDCYLD